MAVRRVQEEEGDEEVAPDGEERATGLPKFLASPNRKVREKAIRLLVAWLSAQKELKDVDLKKIWKGLFYCVWHTDKVPVQADLIQRLASLLLRLDIERSLQFFECFLSTMRREWGGIDRLRLDKFYLLIRKFISSIFNVLHSQNWNEEWVAKFMRALMERSFLAPDLYPAVGVSLHVAECFWSELKPFLPIPDQSFGCLLEPFYSVLSQSSDKILLERVRETVFMSLLTEARSIESCTEKKGDLESTLGYLALRQPLASRLFELAASSAVAQQNRKMLYKLYEESSKLPKPQAAKEAKELDSQSEPGPDGVEAPSEEMSQVSAKKKRRLDVDGYVRQNDEMDSHTIAMEEDPSVGVTANRSVEKVSAKKKQTAAKSQLKSKRTKENKSPVNKSVPSSSKKKRLPARNSQDEEFVNKTESETMNTSLSNGHSLKSIVQKVESEPTAGQGTEVDMYDHVVTALSKRLHSASSDDPESSPVQSPLASFQAFSRLSRSPKNTGSKKRRKPGADNTPSQHDQAGESCEFSPSVGEYNQESGSERKKKKVRFSLKHNIAWKPKSPLPPQSLRLPPSSTPRGSALKKGVPAGPIKASTTPNMAKKNAMQRKFQSDSSLASPRNLLFRRNPLFVRRLSSL